MLSKNPKVLLEDRELFGKIIQAYPKPTKMLAICKQCQAHTIGKAEEQPPHALLKYALTPHAPEGSSIDAAIHRACAAAGGDVRGGTAAPSPQERKVKRDIAFLRRKLQELK